MIEKLIDFMGKNPNDIYIQYSNINGEETFIINGKEIKNESEDEKFDDNEVKILIKDFESLIEDLDDDLFIKFTDELSEVMDINEMNNLIEKESFTEQEAECVKCLITQAKNVLVYVINSQIEYLEDLKDKIN